MKFTIAYKLGLSAALLILVTSGIVGGLFYLKTRELLVEKALEEMSSQIRYAGWRLRAHIETQREDVLLLAHAPPVQGMLRSLNKPGTEGELSYQEWVRQLRLLFITMLKSKSNYSMLRFINHQGQEMVVAGRVGKNEIASSRIALQNKAHRNYFRDTLKIPAGSVYVSEINLNREHGQVSVPHSQVVRSSTPVFSEQTGQVAGILLITSDISSELQEIQHEIQGLSHDIYITNDSGGYLLHPDSSKTYAFDLGKHYRLQDDMPQLASLFLPDHRDTSIVLRPDETKGQKIVNFTKIFFDPARPERFIAVGISQFYSNFLTQQTNLLRNILALAMLFTLIIMLFGVLFAVRLTQPIQQMTQVVKDFTQNRSTDAKLPIDLDDEIGILARSFDVMIVQVMAFQEHLTELNENLEVQVFEQNRCIKQNEAQHSTILDAIAEAIITIDQKGIISSFNPAAEKIFGYQNDEIIGQKLILLIPEDVRQAHEEYTNNSRLNAPRIINQHRELEGVRKDGTLFPMALNVSPMQGDEQSGFVAVLRDISEQKQNEKTLTTALDEAEKANRAKSEFLSSMSHELRTPMNAIIGFSQLLHMEKDPPLSEVQRENVDEILTAAKHLLALINDVLDLAKIEAKRLDLFIETVSVGDVIAESLQLIMALAQKRGIDIRLIWNSTVITQEQLLLQTSTIYADRTRFKQVLLNLLSNAVKYNNDNGKVTISYHCQENNQARISITDQGKGLTQEQQTQLFTAFNRLEIDDANIEGTGIGLVITKNMVELMNGKIGVHCQPDKGCTFWIELPCDINPTKVR